MWNGGAQLGFYLQWEESWAASEMCHLKERRQKYISVIELYKTS